MSNSVAADSGFANRADLGPIIATPRSQAWIGWGLVLLLAGVAAIRWRYLDIPLERDEGEFAYGGQLILAGEVPYQSMYAMKLPGIYAAYALAQAIFGQSVRGIHLGLLVVNLASIGLMFCLARKLFDPLAGLVAATAFAVLTFSVGVMGTLAQAEHFVLLPALGGALLLSTAEDRPRWWLYLVSGLLLGMALLVKQHGAAFVLFGLAFVLFASPAAWRSAPARRLGWLALLATGAMLPLMLAGLIIALRGSWQPFVFWTFTYAREYVREQSAAEAWMNLRRGLYYQWLWSQLLWGLAPLGLGIAVLVPRWRRSRRFVLCWVLASCLAMMPGWYFRYHYFLYLTPALALLAAVALVAIQRGLAHWRWGATVGAGLVVAVLGWSIYQQISYVWPLPPRELSRAFFPGVFAEAPEIGRLIAEHSAVGDRVAVLGSEPELLFYAQRRSATGHIYMYPLMEPQPFALEMQLQAIREIEEAQPEIWIVCEFYETWCIQEESIERILDWSREYVPAHYHQVARIELRGTEPARFFLSPEELASTPESGSLVYIMRRNRPGVTEVTTAPVQGR